MQAFTLNSGFGVLTYVCIYRAEIKRDKREALKKERMVDSTMETKNTERI